MSHNETDEVRRNRNWKMLKPSQKHYALMYIYRLITDPDDIHLYIETYAFLKLAINFHDNLPEFLTVSTPIQLLEEAYTVLGQSPPQHLKDEAKKFPAKRSNILLFTKMPQDELDVIESYMDFKAKGTNEKSIYGLAELAKKLIRKYPNHLTQLRYSKGDYTTGDLA